MRRRELEVTDRAALENILREADACRIAFAVGDTPYIVCMNYGFLWEEEYPTLYFLCAPEGRKIDLMRRNDRVCFQLDTAHETVYRPESGYCTMNFSSIVGTGRLEIVPDEAERRRGLDLLMAHHGHEAPYAYPEPSLNRVLVLRLRVDGLTGKAKRAARE